VGEKHEMVQHPQGDVSKADGRPLAHAELFLFLQSGVVRKI
jgi:hypothetical protein